MKKCFESDESEDDQDDPEPSNSSTQLNDTSVADDGSSPCNTPAIVNTSPSDTESARSSGSHCQNDHTSGNNMTSDIVSESQTADPSPKMPSIQAILDSLFVNKTYQKQHGDSEALQRSAMESINNCESQPNVIPNNLHLQMNQLNSSQYSHTNVAEVEKDPPQDDSNLVEDKRSSRIVQAPPALHDANKQEYQDTVGPVNNPECNSSFSRSVSMRDPVCTKSNLSNETEILSTEKPDAADVDSYQLNTLSTNCSQPISVTEIAMADNNWPGQFTKPFKKHPELQTSRRSSVAFRCHLYAKWMRAVKHKVLQCRSFSQCAEEYQALACLKNPHLCYFVLHSEKASLQSTLGVRITRPYTFLEPGRDDTVLLSKFFHDASTCVTLGDSSAMNTLVSPNRFQAKIADFGSLNLMPCKNRHASASLLVANPNPTFSLLHNGSSHVVREDVSTKKVLISPHSCQTRLIANFDCKLQTSHKNLSESMSLMVTAFSSHVIAKYVHHILVLYQLICFYITNHAQRKGKAILISLPYGSLKMIRFYAPVNSNTSAINKYSLTVDTMVECVVLEVSGCINLPTKQIKVATRTTQDISHFPLEPVLQPSICEDIRDTVSLLKDRQFQCGTFSQCAEKCQALISVNNPNIVNYFGLHSEITALPPNPEILIKMNSTISDPIKSDSTSLPSNSFHDASTCVTLGDSSAINTLVSPDRFQAKIADFGSRNLMPCKNRHTSASLLVANPNPTFSLLRNESSHVIREDVSTKKVLISPHNCQTRLIATFDYKLQTSHKNLSESVSIMAAALSSYGMNLDNWMSGIELFMKQIHLKGQARCSNVKYVHQIQVLMATSSQLDGIKLPTTKITLEQELTSPSDSQSKVHSHIIACTQFLILHSVGDAKNDSSTIYRSRNMAGCGGHKEDEGRGGDLGSGKNSSAEERDDHNGDDEGGDYTKNAMVGKKAHLSTLCKHAIVYNTVHNITNISHILHRQIVIHVHVHWTVSLQPAVILSLMSADVKVALSSTSRTNLSCNLNTPCVRPGPICRQLKANTKPATTSVFIHVCQVVQLTSKGKMKSFDYSHYELKPSTCQDNQLRLDLVYRPNNYCVFISASACFNLLTHLLTNCQWQSPVSIVVEAILHLAPEIMPLFSTLADPLLDFGQAPSCHFPVTQITLPHDQQLTALNTEMISSISSYTKTMLTQPIPQHVQCETQNVTSTLPLKQSKSVLYPLPRQVQPLCSASGRKHIMPQPLRQKVDKMKTKSSSRAAVKKKGPISSSAHSKTAKTKHGPIEIKRDGITYSLEDPQHNNMASAKNSERGCIRHKPPPISHGSVFHRMCRYHHDGNPFSMMIQFERDRLSIVVSKLDLCFIHLVLEIPGLLYESEEMKGRGQIDVWHCKSFTQLCQSKQVYPPTSSQLNGSKLPTAKTTLEQELTSPSDSQSKTHSHTTKCAQFLISHPVRGTKNDSSTIYRNGNTAGSSACGHKEDEGGGGDLGGGKNSSTEERDLHNDDDGGGEYSENGENKAGDSDEKGGDGIDEGGGGGSSDKRNSDDSGKNDNSDEGGGDDFSDTRNSNDNGDDNSEEGGGGDSSDRRNGDDNGDDNSDEGGGGDSSDRRNSDDKGNNSSDKGGGGDSRDGDDSGNGDSEGGGDKKLYRRKKRRKKKRASESSRRGRSSPSSQQETNHCSPFMKQAVNERLNHTITRIKRLILHHHQQVYQPHQNSRCDPQHFRHTCRYKKRKKKKRSQTEENTFVSVDGIISHSRGLDGGQSGQERDTDSSQKVTDQSPPLKMQFVCTTHTVTRNNPPVQQHHQRIHRPQINNHRNLQHLGLHQYSQSMNNSCQSSALRIPQESANSIPTTSDPSSVLPLLSSPCVPTEETIEQSSNLSAAAHGNVLIQPQIAQAAFAPPDSHTLGDCPSSEFSMAQPSPNVLPSHANENGAGATCTCTCSNLQHSIPPPSNNHLHDNGPAITTHQRTENSSSGEPDWNPARPVHNVSLSQHNSIQFYCNILLLCMYNSILY